MTDDRTIPTVRHHVIRRAIRAGLSDLGYRNPDRADKAASILAGYVCGALVESDIFGNNPAELGGIADAVKREMENH